jgi:3-oxoacyl-[acyl-carrier-protein] synthase II
VVITGLGAVTPLAGEIATSWERLIGGRSAAGAISAFDASGFPVRVACEAREFDPVRWIEYGRARRMDRFVQLLVAAARQAEVDSGIEIERESDRVGASVATAMGGMKSLEDCCDTLIERGAGRVSPFSLLAIIPNMGAAWVSIQLGTRGPLSSPCTACAASQMAIGDGLDAIRLDRADVMLCGGTDAAITRTGIAGFAAMRAEPARFSVYRWVVRCGRGCGLRSGCVGRPLLASSCNSCASSFSRA